MKEDMDKNDMDQAIEDWESKCVAPRLKKFKMEKCPTRFYTAKDMGNFNFFKDVGFPGQYPFTAGNDPLPRWQALAAYSAKQSARFEHGTSSAGKYAGFGTAKDYRDYLFRMHDMGRKGGPNIAFDLPTQCGYDSDDPHAEGEVGRVGVALDTFRDFEIIYEAYKEKLDIDKVSSNFTINAPAAIIIAMYVVLAEKRGIPLEKLRGTPQNDILKEFVSRGTYIFPPKPSMRLFRDTLVYCTKHLPNMNITSIGGFHIREAGATREQDLAFSMAIGAAYLQTGIDAGLEIDSYAPHFTFNVFGGSMEIYKEIAFQRAARRMWATMLKERFGAKKKKSMLVRQMLTAHIGCTSTTLQRPLNNLIRGTVGAMAGGMSGGIPLGGFPPFDEPLGLGHSLEAQQLAHDTTRILIYESKLGETLDPWAGSYFMESMTNQIENDAKKEFEKIENMGGVVVAIETGYLQKTIAKSAYDKQKKVENLENFVVGVNCFAGPNEIEVMTKRSVPEVYSQELMTTAETRQRNNLAQTKQNRNSKEVSKTLNELKSAAKKEDINLMPNIINCVKAYATLQEICDVMREIFGEYETVRV